MADRALFERLASTRILVVGDVMLDRYLTGETHRISPEAPVPIVKVVATGDKAGGAANVARNLVHLKAQTALLGGIGNDSDGARLTQLITDEGIESHLMGMAGMMTITKMRVLSRHQQMVRLDYEAAVPGGLGQEIQARFATLCHAFPQVIFSDYGKGTLSRITALIAQAKACGCRVLVDPKSPDFGCYRHADVITPNLAEFRQAGGCTDSEADILRSARALLRDHQIGALVLTRSEAGMTAITPDEHWHFPACVREVSDVTGAGDTVIAVLAVMQGAGLSLPEAAEIANLAAGIVVGKLGAATVSPQELAERLGTLDATRMPVLAPYDPDNSREHVLSELAAARRRGERIVFTNGCFDVLHAGHVHYLTQARALGDRLVIGLNSDASVRRLKGAERPVHGLVERITVLKGLRSVDWVLPFGDQAREQDTPLELIRQVRPDVLVKGGDYTLDQICGAADVLAWGGTVKTLDFVPECSTTRTLARLAAEVVEMAEMAEMAEVVEMAEVAETDERGKHG